MFSLNEKPAQFTQEVQLGAFLNFTVWGMTMADASDLEYGHVIIVDGVNCTMKGNNLYFNATLVHQTEPDKIPFLDFLPHARFHTDGNVPAKLQIAPCNIQGCDEHAQHMPPFHFEDIVMKLKADQPLFKPFIEFNFTIVDGNQRIAVGATVRPSLCEQYVEKTGVMQIIEDIIPYPDKWNFTLAGHLTAFVTGSNQRIFLANGFFYHQ